MKAKLEHLDKVSIIINRLGNNTTRWFITVNCAPGTGLTGLTGDIYLHRDGTLRNYCGVENFFATFKDAATFISELSDSLSYKSVELNGQYTAKIYKDRVEVGCQSFPIEKIKDILREHRKAFQ
jgi:hypothetical protein